MAEKTLYTALGHFRCRNDGGGRRYPVVLMDHREFGMDPQEMTLWTALCWRLTDRQRAEDFYEQLSNGMELFPRRSFSDCLDRLVTRGLVAKGSGTTDFDALYDLLGGLYVVPISSSFPLKVVTFLKLLRSGTAPGSASALFRRDRRTEPERHIMQNKRSLLMNMEKLGQIQLPAPEDFDPHPRLLLNGRGIHAGETFRALFPDGWREITIEMSWEPEGPGCWYISTPGFTHICPIGLFVKE